MVNIQEEDIGQYSRIVRMIKSSFPIVGIVGLTHGDEIVGRKVLDRLQTELPSQLQQGEVRLIYANLPAEEAGKPYIDVNLNRIFPGKENGKLEERIAYNLRPALASCSLVVDIHSTTLDYGAFVVTTVDPTQFETTAATRSLYDNSGLFPEGRHCFDMGALGILTRNTGLVRHVQMDYTVANGGSLIEFVNAHGKGYGLSIEAGQHLDPKSEETAMEVVLNMLKAQRVIAGEPKRREQEVYLGREFIPVPSPSFKPSEGLTNFGLLKAGTPYGTDGTQSYTLDKDSYVVLFSQRMRDGKVFLRTDKIS